MSRTISATYTSTVKLTNTANNPITLTSTAKLTPTAINGGYGGLYGKGLPGGWTITNAGIINDGTNVTASSWAKAALMSVPPSSPTNRVARSRVRMASACITPLPAV